MFKPIPEELLIPYPVSKISDLVKFFGNKKNTLVWRWSKRKDREWHLYRGIDRSVEIGIGQIKIHAVPMYFNNSIYPQDTDAVTLTDSLFIVKNKSSNKIIQFLQEGG